MPDPQNPKLLRRIAIAAIIIVALAVFILNIIYQLQYGALSGVSYKYYLIASGNAVLVLLGAYVVYRIILYILMRSLGSRIDPGTADITKIALRTVTLAVAIVIILITFGVNSQNALGVGAVGGIAIGLAVQTIATNILSGFFVSTSRVVRPGDVVVMRSAAWGEFTASVVNVSLLWTYVVNQFGNSMHIPNSALFGNTLFTKLKYPDELRYLLRVTVNPDAPTKKVKEKATREITTHFVKRKLPVPKIYFISSEGMTNTFAVALRFSKFAELNELIDIVNESFNNAYWESRPKP